ncbi:MAG: LamG domain-containing protein [Pirellulales bacterium]
MPVQRLRFLLWLAVLIALRAQPTARADYASEVLADGPLAYWRFEDGSAGTVLGNFETAVDSVGAYAGTYLWGGLADGPQLSSGVPGIGQTAVHFVRGTTSQDGEYIQSDSLGNFGSSIDNNGATFEFWVRNLEDNPASNRLFGISNNRPESTPTTQFSFGFEDLQERFGGPADSVFLRNENNEAWAYMIDDSAVDIKDGNWHHVAWVIDSGVPANGTRIYLDGQLATFIPAIFDGVTDLTPKPLANFADFDKGFILGGEHLSTALPGSYTINSMVDEFAIYGRALSQSEIQTHLAGVPVATVFHWNHDGLGSWTGGNWTPQDGVIASRPDANNATAVLGGAISAPRTVAVQADITVKTLQFDSSQSYVVAGGGSVNLDANTGNASISVTQGSHQLQAVVNLHDNTVANISAGATLEVNNRLNLQGHTLTKTGTGNLAINNIVDLDGGSLVGTSGSISGSGSILGDLENPSGTVSPGNSPGALQIHGNYTQGVAGTLQVELAAGEHDVLQVSGTAALAGTLQVSLLDGFQPAAGDRFDILQSASIVGTFDAIQLAPLTNGRRWDVSELYSTGSLVVAVPEPATGGLLATLLCLGLIGVRRRVKVAAPLAAIAGVLFGSAAAARADYVSAVLASNPEAYWRFEDGAVGAVLNGATAADATGNHPGTYLNIVSDVAQLTDGPQMIAGAPGVGGTAAHFVGTSSTAGDLIRFTTLGNVGSNIDNNGLTFEFLLKNPEPSTVSNRIFGMSTDRPVSGAPGRKYTMSFGFSDLNLDGVPGNEDALFLRDDTDDTAWAYATNLGGVDIEDGNWHHVVWVIDPGIPTDGTRFYVDGNLVPLVAPTTGLFTPKALSDFSNFDKDFTLGAEHLTTAVPGSAPNGLFRTFARNSIVDEFAVYSDALTQQEIAAHIAEITATTFQWKTPGLGDWNLGGNWEAVDGVVGALPNSNTMTGIFGAALTEPTVVATEAVVTAKTLQFDNTNTVIAGNGSVQLQANTGSASLLVTQGSHQFQADVDLASNTTANISGGAVLEMNNRFSLNGNTLTKSGSGSLLINNNQNTGTGSVSVSGGVLGGGGRVSGNLTNAAGGTVAPGASAGVLTVQGNYIQQPGSTLAIEIGGLTEGQSYDVLNVTGSMTLNGGTLSVSLIDGFMPAAGNSFDILDFASRIGSFTTLNLQGGAGSWNTSQLLTTGTITFTGSASVAGDYNGNGTVDAADYVVWRNTLRPSITPGTGADGTGDGVINQADYNFWKSRFGATSGSGSGNTGVPEPTAAALLGLLLVAAIGRGATCKRLG